jgi:CelD/BcsL family acetyltransferase involved in cellulose biosynthesis
MSTRIEVHGAIAPLAGQWDELADRATASPFLRPGWFDAWWRAFGSGRLEIVTLSREGRLAAVAPLHRRRELLQSVTNWHTPEFDVLAEDGPARRELLERLLRGRTRPVTLRFLTAGSAGEAAARAAAGPARRRAIVRTLEYPPYVPIDGTWEEYLARRDRHRLSENRRRRRRLAEQGRLELAIEDGRKDLDALLEEGFRVEASGWKAAEGTAIASRPETRQFYTEIARWAAGRGWLRLAFLRLDEHAIAFQFLIVADGVASQLKGGYDPEHRKHAPGMLLAESVLEWAFSEGLRRYEFHGVDEHFKQEWAPATHELRAVELFPRTPAGTLAWAAFAYGRPAAKRLRELRGR